MYLLWQNVFDMCMYLVIVWCVWYNINNINIYVCDVGNWFIVDLCIDVCDIVDLFSFLYLM